MKTNCAYQTYWDVDCVGSVFTYVLYAIFTAAPKSDLIYSTYLCVFVRQSVDVGGCVSVHVFGAVFGVAASRALSRHFPEATPRPSRASQVTAFVGERLSLILFTLAEY